MIYKHMYCCYKNSGKIKIKEDDRIITASAASFEDLSFLYFETKDEKLLPSDVAEGDLKSFPNGDVWFEMPEVFHYFTPKNDDEWKRKISGKTPVFRINKLNMDKVASYIYYHVDHQHTNQYECDKFFSIFNYGNIIIMYSEEPTEWVTWQDIEGRYHEPPRKDWADLMNQHFKTWPDGEKKWVKMKNE